MRVKRVIALTLAALMITSTALAAPGGGGMKSAPGGGGMKSPQPHIAVQQPRPLPPQPALPRPLHHHHHDSGRAFVSGMLGAVIGAIIGSAATSGN